jgi:hypothetical protein
MMDISRSSAEEGEITDDSQQDMIDDSLALEDERDKSEERLANGSIDTLSRRHGSGRSPQSLSLSIEDEYAPDPSSRPLMVILLRLLQRRLRVRSLSRILLR